MVYSSRQEWKHPFLDKYSEIKKISLHKYSVESISHSTRTQERVVDQTCLQYLFYLALNYSVKSNQSWSRDIYRIIPAPIQKKPPWNCKTSFQLNCRLDLSKTHPQFIYRGTGTSGKQTEVGNNSSSGLKFSLLAHKALLQVAVLTRWMSNTVWLVTGKQIWEMIVQQLSHSQEHEKLWFQTLLSIYYPRGPRGTRQAACYQFKQHLVPDTLSDYELCPFV